MAPNVPRLPDVLPKRTRAGKMWVSELLRSSSQYQSQKRAAPEHRAQRSEHGAQLVAAVNCRAYEFRIKPFVLQAKMSSTYSLQHGLFRSAKSWRKRIIATSCILFLFSSYASCMAINVPRLSDVFGVAQRSQKCAEGQARTRAQC